jgi:16S rRNA processing protein RimM
MATLIALGYVTRAFGIRGGVGVKLFSNESETIKPEIPLILRQKSTERTLIVKEVLPHGRLYFIGVNSREEAEALRGAEIFIERSLLPDLASDEFYLGDLLGAEVRLLDGTVVGELVAFSSNNAQVLLEVKDQAGRISSVPLVKAIVKEIDAHNKKIVIDPPEGLLDV